MKSRVKISDGKLIFTSELAERLFFSRNEDKYAYLVIDDAPTGEMRRFFEGAVVPAVFYQQGGWADFGECREALKLEFLPIWLRTVAGRQAKLAKSTANLSKAQFSAFLEEIQAWMVEQGMETPDSADYKSWRDSAPPAGAVYPPLARLKAQYEEVHKSLTEKK